MGATATDDDIYYTIPVTFISELDTESVYFWHYEKE